MYSPSVEIQLNLLQHNPVFFFSDDVHCLFYSVLKVNFACRARYTISTDSFSRGHDPITQVRGARFLTDVGDLPFSVIVIVIVIDQQVHPFVFF